MNTLLRSLIFLIAPTSASIASTVESAPPPVSVDIENAQPNSPIQALSPSTETSSTESRAFWNFTAVSGDEVISQLLVDAENGTVNVTLSDPTSTATLIQSTVVFEGDHTFHLTNPSFNDTSVTLTPGIQVGPDTRLVFATKFETLTTDQVAKVQVSSDGGSSYPATIWSRPGTGSPSGGFELIEIDLSTYAGQTIHLRFILDFSGGSAFTQTTTSVGWFFDYISIGTPAARPAYSIGDPTALEQYNLELINRSRADALAEADRLIALASPGGDPDIISAVTFFKIKPPDIRTQYEWAINNGYIAASAQPLAFNAKLIEAARLHTADMLLNNFQGHTTSANPPPEATYPAGATLGTRVTASGYGWSSLGESVFAYADSVLHAHAGFLIDWGNLNNPAQTGYNPAFIDQGMQNPPGHRFSNHNPNHKEIGIGFIEGSNTDVGPFLVTQDFAKPATGDQFITGVVIADMDNDDFYDVGEGLGGIVITAESADGSTPRPAYRAITANSGGYALPVPADGTYTVTFSHPTYGTVSTDTTLTGGENLKVDWIPAILHTSRFGFKSDQPSKMELTFLHAGIDGTPRLQTTTNLALDFSTDQTADLSPRDETGHRTFTYDNPGTPTHFARVIVD